MRAPLIAGNWKMNGSRASVQMLLQNLKDQLQTARAENVIREDVEWAVFPPSVFLQECQEQLKDTAIALGAQNMSGQAYGAFTGEISASMLKDFDCQYVIVGHSERRTLFKETNMEVALKFVAALHYNLRPILCVGESEVEHAAGLSLSVVHEQLAAVLSLDDNLPNLEKAVIAYEPVWAIGTGKNATPAQAQEIHAAIRQQLARHRPKLAEEMRIIYGGSVKPENAAGLLAMPDIDGALVGGASLQAKQFIAIGEACNP
ncbi:MAG TPA: triose-phosphate isomerase [Coxiellaceae bacterium]|nr:triose-phosphate isomerase [Coxiellaceae bacterium]